MAMVARNCLLELMQNRFGFIYQMGDSIVPHLGIVFSLL